MSRLLRIFLYGLGALLVLFVAFAAFVQFAPLPTYDNQAPEITINPDSLKLTEGARIVTTLCSSCHLSPDGKLGGQEMKDAGAFGTIYSTNITNHPEYGALSRYTNGELAYLIRTGIKKDGSYAPPWMVKLPSLSDEDMEAILVYLRSDAPELQPSNTPNKISEINFLAKMLLKTKAFKPLPYPDSPMPSPNTTDKVIYGKYLALSKWDCYACHSADFATCDFLEPEKSVGFMGGGNPIPNRNGDIIYSANLTMDKETGLGDWSEEQFIRAVKSGIRPNNIATRYPMPPYTVLTDEEVSAIWAYLQTVPEIHNPNDFTPDLDQ